MAEGNNNEAAFIKQYLRFMTSLFAVLLLPVTAEHSWEVSGIPTRMLCTTYCSWCSTAYFRDSDFLRHAQYHSHITDKFMSYLLNPLSQTVPAFCLLVSLHLIYRTKLVRYRNDISAAALAIDGLNRMRSHIRHHPFTLVWMSKWA